MPALSGWLSACTDWQASPSLLLELQIGSFDNSRHSRGPLSDFALELVLFATSGC